MNIVVFFRQKNVYYYLQASLNTIHALHSECRVVDRSLNEYTTSYLKIMYKL